MMRLPSGVPEGWRGSKPPLSNLAKAHNSCTAVITTQYERKSHDAQPFRMDAGDRHALQEDGGGVEAPGQPFDAGRSPGGGGRGA